VLVGPAGPEALDERAGKRRAVRDPLAWLVRYAEAAAQVDQPRRPAEPLAAAPAELDESVDREEALVRAVELRADMDMDADRIQTCLLGGHEGCERLLGVEAELRPVVRGLDRLVRVRLDAGREPDQYAADGGSVRSFDLLHRVEHEDRAGGRRGLELGVGLVVPVDDQPVPLEAGPPRECELAEGGNVRSEPLVGEQPQDRDVRERLHAVDDERIRVDLPVHPRLREQGLAAVRDERCPEALRELGRGDAADREHALVRSGRVREERERHVRLCRTHRWRFSGGPRG